MNQHRWTCLTVFVLNAMAAPIAAVGANALPSPTTNNDDFGSQLLQSLPRPLIGTALKIDPVIPAINQAVPQVSKLPIVTSVATKAKTAPKTKTAPAQTDLKIAKIGNLPTKQQQSGRVFLAATATFSPDLRVPNSVGTPIVDRSASIIPPANTPVNPVTPLPKLADLAKSPSAPTSPILKTFSSKKIGAPIPISRENTALLARTTAPTAIVNSATVQAEIAPPQTDNSRVFASTSPTKERVETDPKPQVAPVVQYRNDRAEIPSFEAGVPVFVFEDKHPSQIVATAIAQIGDTIVAPEPSIAIPVMRPTQSTVPTRSPGASAPVGRPFANSSGTVEQSPTTVQPMLNRVVSTHTGKASWYGSEGGSKTANGERYNPQGLTAAHRTLPFGTKVRVTSIKTGKSAIVRINDRGPFRGNRAIDISAGAAEAIGLKSDGVGEVRIEVLSDRV
ncbi:septal ring lytic transglycosylase RlpA family protein [Chamaesiphon sp. OTE_75_metabat_556]|uniref:septal ring lytic transglycosylase RlpA family protein n=1 Tax=Chamaesiphon sp. OTE_75_metabat_556 TaxID=2964692 RepID=UPI00286B3210|nr:septal ring lytic transglycosylase RlpA family protein [Chamaesiphon sp. OTE_75_metabat_556]